MDINPILRARRALALAWLVVGLVGAGAAGSAPPDEAALREEQKALRAESKAIDDEAAAKAYLRMGSWNLESRGSRRAGLDHDLAGTAEVVSKFHIIALQDPGPESNVEAVRTIAAASLGKPWRAVSAVDGQADPTILWDESKVTYARHRVFPSPHPQLVSPVLVAEMQWQDRSFFFASAAVYMAGVSAQRDARTNVAAFLTDVMSRFRPEMPPVFLGLATRGAPLPEAMDFLFPYVTPVLRSGDITLGAGGARVDNILTNFRRPVRTGPYPFHKAMILESRDASRKISSHLPVIVLSNLAD